MASHAGNGGQPRRKSMGLFSKPSLTRLTKLNTNVTGEKAEHSQDGDKKKMNKRSSIFGMGPSSTADSNGGNRSPVLRDGSNSPSLRARALQRSRPPSLLESLGKKSNFSPEEEDSKSVPQSPADDGMLHVEPGVLFGRSVRHHGEVQTSGIFRKKKEYLVLTDTHLIRFKSQSRALDAFPSIRHQLGRQMSTRHASTISITSLQDAQSQHSHTSGDWEVRIPLEQIVTVYRMEDLRPYFIMEVVHLDEINYGMGSLQLMLGDPSEADLWLSSIRAAAMAVRVRMIEPYPEQVVHYLVRVVESANDYDPRHFKIYRVVRRPPPSKGGRSSSDDMNRLGAALFYMVIGINRVHMIPVPDFSDASSTLVNTFKLSKNSFGLVTLVALSAQPEDDRFEVAFRSPLHPTKLLQLAASATLDIAIDIARASQYLMPQWLDPWYVFGGPKHLVKLLEDQLDPYEEDYGCFDRTLIAYCMAYNCNPHNIQYAVDWDVEDAPAFKLFPPAETTRYSLTELLAIFRALRYNEYFRTISFRGIDLHVMHGLHDQYGNNHVAFTTRAGISIQAYFSIRPHQKSMLYQEVQGIALKSTVLRRLDFADCLPRRRPRDTFDVEEDGLGADRDPGCEIISALMPLCREELISTDWLILNGIELGETDLDDLIPTLNVAKTRLRALECSRCGLNDRGIMQILSHLERQNATLECLDLADNAGKVHLERFKISMSCFSNLRKLDVSRITRALDEEPLFDPEVMLCWRLEEFIMNGVPVNDKTLDTISAYLASEMSDRLRTLQMNQCNLTGSHVAILMRSMSRNASEPRNLELHVSTNKLEKGVSRIASAIEENHAPSRIVCQMIEFADERHFRQLLHALRKNTTIESLDLSKASLPYDASDETCEVLRLVFEQNETLKDLDISGEHAHLEVTRFGIGLNQALTGLKHNTTLKSLRIEHQNLGFEGANTLASVLQTNTGLTHIYCEHNNINLQGFTILVNAIAQNTTVLDLPIMHNDKGESMRQWRRESNKITPNRRDNSMKSSVRRHLSTLVVAKNPKPAASPPDIDTVVRVLQEKWEAEVRRLVIFLARNRGIAEGREISAPEHEKAEEAMRSTTAVSDRQCIEQAIQDATPTVELDNPINNHARSTISLINSPNKWGGKSKEKAIASSALDDDKHEIRASTESIDTPLLPLPSITPSDKMFELGGGFMNT